MTEYEPDQAAKITGMMLELDNKDLLHLLSNQKGFSNKAAEAAEVLATPSIIATTRPKKRWVPVATPLA